MVKPKPNFADQYLSTAELTPVSMQNPILDPPPSAGIQPANPDFPSTGEVHRHPCAGDLECRMGT
ncbi:hypothetical protein K432DRAFT_385859 [Lepidopterella palustris CBS 459.81]|uniref:Uncharacterized protein n=1 Tax=Lepidopterella palustris CBS 459.81 TaxID=1314670 RepID=A0A8E2JB21_9PEZI|nr:hypothetical protein K432DRAFT_385859 [Lepidopterella palustris CBS 459.81]